MALILDSSVAASWALPDEDAELVRIALPRLLTEDIYVPSIFWHEIRNIVLVNERRKRLDEAQSMAVIDHIAGLEPFIDNDADHNGILALGRAYALSAYDAAYLELAKRLGGTLLTLDDRLSRAASTERVAFDGL